MSGVCLAMFLEIGVPFRFSDPGVKTDIRVAYGVGKNRLKPCPGGFGQLGKRDNTVAVESLFGWLADTGNL